MKKMVNQIKMFEKKNEKFKFNAIFVVKIGSKIRNKKKKKILVDHK